MAAWGAPNGLDPELFERRIADVSDLLHGTPLMRVGDPNRSSHPRHGRAWLPSMPLRPWPAPDTTPR